MQVWALEGGREEARTWVKRFTVVSNGKPPQHSIALPHAVHGEHILTTWSPGGVVEHYYKQAQ
jgi:hypothetical protein